MFKFFIIIFFFLCFYNIVFNRKNLIMNLIFIELAFLSINLFLILNVWLFNDVKGQIIIIYILTLTAIETAVGLALFIVYYKIFKTIEVEDFYQLKF